MSREELEKAVLEALNRLYARDTTLLSDDAAEWTITHRLAVYIENALPGWDVDCEYNRQGPNADTKVRDNASLVRPDIIVHHRRLIQKPHNLLAVEIKKHACDHDSDKTREYTDRPNRERLFQYQYGVTISLDGPELVWYKDGRVAD